MPINWNTYRGFTPAGCLPCCSDAPTPPAECACALLIPPFASPYADYATAETAIADSTLDCLLYSGTAISSYSTFTLTPGTSSYAVAANQTGGPSIGDLLFWMSVTVASASVLTVDYSGTMTPNDPLESEQWEVGIIIYDCEGNVVGTFDDVVASTTISGSEAFPITTGDVYYVRVSLIPSASFDTTGPDLAMTADISSDDTMVANPVIALWDDGGTTRQLWACPKLLLPPLTESTGTWYADCAAADAVLTDASQVSNCVGFFVPDAGIDTITATDGGTSLALRVQDSTLGGFSGTGAMYGGINAEAGETITVTGTTDGGTYDISASVYDDTGTLVEDFSTTGSTTATSSALPYTGRYTVIVSMTTPPPGTPPTDMTATITSSGTMSVNEIQARYDLGLTCAGTLDCGDACP